MSIRVIQWVWDHSQSVGNDRLVLLAIADCANERGENAYPAILTLAKKCNISERTVQRSIKQLKAIGELGVCYRSDGEGNNISNCFSIFMSTGDNLTPGGDNQTPPSRQSDTTPGDNLTPKPSITSEPSNNQNTNSRSASRKKKEINPELHDYDPDLQQGVEIPQSLQTEAIMEHWRLWLEYRRVRKKNPVTVGAARTQLKELSTLIDPIQEILRTIDKGWSGFYPQESNKGSPSQENQPIKRAKLVLG